MKSLKGKTVWITGASSGIGEALAIVLSKEGANVVLSARREEELLRVQQKAELNDENSLVLPLDVEKTDSFPKKYMLLKEKFGRLDILINNAGISQRAFFKDTDLSVCKRIIDINFFGTVALTKCVLNDFIAQKSGLFVTVTSVTGKYGTPLRTIYAASKHALHGFFDALRAEHWKENIKVLLVAPGYVKTNLSYNAVLGDGSKQNKLDEGQKNGITPENCAQQIVKAIKSGKREIYPGGFKEVAGVWLKRFFPAIFARIVRNVNVR
ncbi:MAG: SDR family NAD(P)-dependent oxidoreductase [Flammeovirgaceae bacterium]